LVTHDPVAGLQVSPTGQLTGAPEQVPPAHTSPVVHRLPSLHAAVLFACAQPEAGTHESLVQGLLSSQFGAAPPTHTPPAQVSAVVHALPSVQDTVLLACAQPDAGTQESVVHTFPSSQLRAVPATHVPVTHVSIPLQALLSLQSAFVTQPVAGALNVTLRSGRRALLAVVDSVDSRRSPFVPAAGGRMAHPTLLAGAADHA
jgi:hypothetical protein